LQQHSGKGKGYIALTITSIVWGTTWVISKIGVREIPALQMSAIRQCIAGSLLVLFFLLYKKFPLPTLRQFRWILVMAVLMFVSANGLSTWGIKYIPTGLGALIGALYPLTVVILEKLFFKGSKLTLLTFAGLFLGLTGIAIVFYENAFHHMGPDFLFGISLSVIAMFSWSLGTVFLSRNKENINPYYGVGWQMLLSSLILFVVSSLTQPVVPLTEISRQTWLVILYLVFFGSLLAFAAFIFSMKKLPAAVASLYAYMNPLVAMMLAALILDETLTWDILWGSVVTLLGVFLVNYSIKKDRAVIAESEI